MESNPKTHVVVVGAGLAGLAAAWRLTREGCRVTLLEQSQRVGASVVGEWNEGFSVDDTPPIILSSDRHLLGWISEAGLADSLLPPRPLRLMQVHRGAVHPIETATLSGLAGIRGVRGWDKKRLLRLPRLMQRYRPLLDPDRPERAASLDFRSAEDFARLYFGSSLWHHWVSPAAMSAYGGEDSELSRVAFLLSRVASDDGRATFGVLRRGLQDLAVEVAARLGVHLGAEVHEIEQAPAGRYRVHCGVEGMSDESRRTVEADAVVIATSARTAARIAHEVVTLGERDFFAHVQTGPIVSLCLALDHVPAGGPQLVRVPHAESSPIECYLVEAGSAGGRAPEGKGLITLVANQRFADANAGATDEVVEKALLAGLSRVHSREVGSVRFTRLRRTQDARSLFHVRAYRELDRFQKIQQDRGEAGRRLYFAGDYLSGPRPENAVSSGKRAAGTLLSHLAGS